MSWTDASAAWLQQAIAEHPEMTPAELRRWCRKNYPWHQRSGWAYKAWLKVLRKHFNPQGTRPDRRHGVQQLSHAELEKLGQLRLPL